MDQFRLILLLIGIVLLVLVYYRSRRSGAKPGATPKSKSPLRPKIPMSGDVAPPERPYQAALEQNKKPQRRKRCYWQRFSQTEPL